MESVFPQKGSWMEWWSAAQAASRGDLAHAHVDLDGGEIRMPVYHPHRQVSSVRARSASPWKLSVEIDQPEQVMAALQGGAESLRLRGCQDPGGWLDGVVKGFVELEFIQGPTVSELAAAKALPESGGVLLDWWSGEDISSHLDALQKNQGGHLRAVLITDAAKQGWTLSGRLALLIRACEEAVHCLGGDLSRVSLDLCLDRDPVVALASSEALKTIASQALAHLGMALDQGHWRPQWIGRHFGTGQFNPPDVLFFGGGIERTGCRRRHKSNAKWRGSRPVRAGEVVSQCAAICSVKNPVWLIQTQWCLLWWMLCPMPWWMAPKHIWTSSQVNRPWR